MVLWPLMGTTLSRRTFLVTALAVGGLLATPLAAASTKPTITVYHDPG